MGYCNTSHIRHRIHSLPLADMKEKFPVPYPVQKHSIHDSQPSSPNKSLDEHSQRAKHMVDPCQLPLKRKWVFKKNLETNWQRIYGKVIWKDRMLPCMVSIRQSVNSAVILSLSLLLSWNWSWEARVNTHCQALSCVCTSSIFYFIHSFIHWVNKQMKMGKHLNL